LRAQHGTKFIRSMIAVLRNPNVRVMRERVFAEIMRYIVSIHGGWDLAFS